MYHHLQNDDSSLQPYAISVDQFLKELDLLGKFGFKTLSFAELHRVKSEGRLPPRKSVIITFDDGFESFRELAVPALAAREMQATVFVVAGEIGGYNRWEADNFPHRPLMDDAGIREIVDKGMELGSHGWNHRDLTRSSCIEVGEELCRSRAELQRRFGVTVNTFAYPYGRFNPNHFQQLKQAGYRMAVSIFSAEPTVTANPYAMRRVYVHDDDTALRFRCKLSQPYLCFLAWQGIPQPQIT